MPEPKGPLSPPKHAVCETASFQVYYHLGWHIGIAKLTDELGDDVFVYETPVFEGQFVENAYVYQDAEHGDFPVHVFLTQEGADWFSEFSFSPSSPRYAILSEGRVVCAPYVVGHTANGSFFFSLGYDKGKASRVCAGLLGLSNESDGDYEDRDFSTIELEELEALEQAHYARCLTYLNKKLSDSPGDKVALRRRLAFSIEASDLHAALDYLNVLIEYHPDDLIAICERASLKLAIGDSLGAIQDFELALEKGEDREIVSSDLAEAYHASGMHEQALEELNWFIESRRRVGPTQWEGDLFSALAELTSCIIQRSDILTDLGRFEDAERKLLQSIDEIHNYEASYDRDFSIITSGMWSEIARHRFDAGRIAEAIKACNKALALASDYVEALCTRGHAYLKIGAHQLAADDFEAALSIEPTFTDCVDGLALAKRQL